jgi:hypothetical protein
MTDGFDWVDRGSGILTKRDRQFLTGELGEELTENDRNVKRYEIRNRILNALYDFKVISGNLQLRDYQQIFEPAYEWGRERRRLNEDGRTTASPDFGEFLQAWLSLIEFYTTGFYLGGLVETDQLMQGLVEEGIERGFRMSNLSSQVRQPISAGLSVEYGSEMLLQNYHAELKNDLPREADARAERVMQLYHERKIGSKVAQQWMQYNARDVNSE